LVAPGERLTCQAIRSLSDYLARGENPSSLIYNKYGIPDSEYILDMRSNTHIVHLQSDVGHWYYIPSKYILSFPKLDGVPYRSMMVQVSLPAIPTSKTLDNLMDDLRQVTLSHIGVSPNVSQIETSRVVMVAESIHSASVLARQQSIGSGESIRTKYEVLLARYTALQQKCTELESYIKDFIL
jgi:hypothetical protein